MFRRRVFSAIGPDDTGVKLCHFYEDSQSCSLSSVFPVYH